VELVGRQWEMAGADRFLDDLADGPAALVLEGEPGIGKTTVWRAIVNSAQRRSYRILVCRTTESESALSFLGLGDLLESTSDATLDALPEPQRQALHFALLRSSGEGSPDRVAVARGTLAVLRAAASETPTLVAIDDAQWLDPPSADVLRFAAHRLTAEHLGMLVSTRNGGARTLELDRSLPENRVTRVRLQALTFEELQDVVRAQLPVNLPQTTWRALYRISAGNPFFALQLAEALEARGGSARGERLPIPETLSDAMRERLAALSVGAGAALLPIAALAQPTLSLLREAGIEHDGVHEAVQAGVLHVDGERVRFTHPLLGSFVYGDASDAERRDVHRLLATLVTDQEEHALHLARGTVEPDEAVASTLEATADQAAKRGHPEIAAELAEHAARLTAAERAEDRARRVRETAQFLFAVGDAPRCRELLEELFAQLPPSEERARALSLLALTVSDASRSIALFEDALAQTEEDLELRSRILSFLCWMEGLRDRWDAASRRGREAVELAERSGSRSALAESLGRLAWSELGPARMQMIERAEELERSLSEQVPWALSPGFVHGMFLFALDRIDEARRQFEDVYERAVAMGDWFRSIYLAWLAEVELRAGNWEKARAHARGTRELDQTGLRVGEAWGAASSALVEAHLGNEEDAVRAGEHASRLARADGIHLCLVRSEFALGLLRLSLGDVNGAVDHLLPLVETKEGISLWPGFATRTLSNAIEALVAAGDPERARSVVVRLEEHARSMAVPSAIAAAARCRALVLAQDGNVDAARASIKKALSEQVRLHEPFELARTYLAQGSIERRARRKGEARIALGKAEAIFDELGARLWLERTQRELARTGVTRSFDRQLTPTERRVAELAASGAHNKEIAGALFVSVKAVEANLSRVYAKLGIRSRVELASGLAKEAQHGSGRAAQRYSPLSPRGRNPT
jgi:DNA-binding CsgD family transcriptional regulator